VIVFYRESMQIEYKSRNRILEERKIDKRALAAHNPGSTAPV